ncbi:MAG: hypothetical protein ACK58N_14160 [Synechocystis sp.]
MVSRKLTAIADPPTALAYWQSQQLSQSLTSSEEQEIVCPRYQSTHCADNGFIQI